MKDDLQILSYSTSVELFRGRADERTGGPVATSPVLELSPDEARWLYEQLAEIVPTLERVN